MISPLGSTLLCVYFQAKKEQTNINCLKSLIQINFKTKQGKKFLYLKNELNQDFVIALPDWLLLCQVS